METKTTPEEQELRQASPAVVADPEYPKQSMVFIGGKSFRCPDCGANVFTQTAPGRYVCNGCDSRWIGE